MVKYRLRVGGLGLAAGALCVLLLVAISPAAQPGGAELRARAWDALRSKVQDKKYLNHSLAVEAIMGELAAAAGEDKDEWGVAGLLHDIDIASTKDDLSKHGLVGGRILSELGFSRSIVHAVRAHDDRAGVVRSSRLDHAVYCADQLYWLLAAADTGFGSEKLHVAEPDGLWSQIQSISAKREVAAKVATECAMLGLTAPKAIAAARTASQRSSTAP